jgi:hypothetical protein
LDWRVADDFAISFANEFMSQIGREELVITFGQLMLPALVNPTPEEVAALPPTISPRIVARVAVTPFRLRALIGLLQGQLQQFDSGRRGIVATEGDEGD